MNGVGRRAHRGLSGISTSAGVGVLSMAAGIVLLPFILGAVSTGQYGLWLVLTSSVMLLYYSDLGIGSAIIHFSSKLRGGGERYQPSELLSAGLLWAFLASLVIVPSYSALGYWYLSGHAESVGLDTGTRLGLLTCGAVMMSALLIRPFGSALVGAGLLPIERRNQGIAVVTRIVGTLLVCWLAPSLLLIAAVEVLAAVLPSVLSSFSIVRLGSFKLRWTASTLTAIRYMLGYSSKAFAYSLIDTALLLGGTIAAGILATPADATFFNVAYRIFSSVRQLINWITEPLRPAMSRLYSFNRASADDLLYALCRVLLFGASMGCLLLALAGPLLIELWLGSDDVPITLIAQASALLLVGLVLSAMHIPLAAAAYSAGRPAAFLAPQTLWLIAFLVLVTPLTSTLGIVGIALSLTTPLILIEPISIYVAHRVLSMNVRRWLLDTVAPTAYLIAGGGVALLAMAAATDGRAMNGESIVPAFSFTVGVLVAAAVNFRTVPVNSLRIIFKTEL